VSEVKMIKTALIGSGAISGIYLQNLTQTFHITDMAGCSDILPERSKARAEEYKIRQMTNEEILSDPAIRIVVNTTFPQAHYEVSRAALLAGKHVYSEKMIAVTLEEGKELVKLAKEKNLLMTTAPDTFLGAGHQTARLAIDAGLIGEPIQVVGVCQRGYHPTGAVKRVSMVQGPGGGIPFDMGGYYLHAMVNLFGPVKRATGFAQTRNKNRTFLNPRHPDYEENFEVDTINNMAATMEFVNGILGTLVVTSESIADTARIEVIGTYGSLTIHDPNDFSGPIVLRRRNCEPCELPLTHGFKENCRGVGVADMAYALRNKRTPRASADMGLHVFELIHGVWSGTESGKIYELTTTCSQPKALRQGDFGPAQEHVLDD
jgi:predicted dehydrogenase